MERVVKPMAGTGALRAAVAAGGGKAVSMPIPTAEEKNKKELVAALNESERTVILHDANLGTVPIANRQKLNHALATGIRAATISKATDTGTDPTEAVRVVEDALSLVKDVTFLGQVSKKIENKKKPELSHMTLPIKLTFEDKGARIHFERTIGARSGLRATMSLPNQVRKAQSAFHEEIKKRYPNDITMVRTDVGKLRFIAFHKEDGGPKWLPCTEVRGIPLDVLRDNNPAVEGGELGAGVDTPPMDGE